MARKSVYLKELGNGKFVVRWYAPQSDDPTKFRHLARTFDKKQVATEFKERLLGVLKEEPQSPMTALGYLLTEIEREGRTIIPVIGSDFGVSDVATCAYLLRQRSYIESRFTSESKQDWLLRHGWTKRHRLHSEVAIRRRTAETLAHRWRDDLYDLVAGGRLTPRDQEELVDSFHRNEIDTDLQQSRQRFVAFLARLLDWKLILTACLDRSIEEALRSQELLPNSVDPYELDMQRSHLEPRRASGNEVMLVHLHGNSASQMLADPPLLRHYCIERIKRLLPEDALLLLVGESGHDQRITQLIAAVANDTKATSSDLNVIWVTSNPLPPAAQRVCMSGTVCVARYFDCELFLQELYYRSATAFPATTNTYAALPPYPPARIDGDVIELSQKKTASLPINVAYLSQDNDPSVELSRIAASFNPSCKRVWMDCDAVTSGEELFENMAWQLRRYDPELLPALLVSVAKTRWPTDRDICVELLKRATKRDDYLFVVNSLETEATSNASAPERNGAMEFVDVVQKLVHDDDGLLNDSQILLGIINGDTSRRAEKRTEITAHAEIWDQPARTDSSILLEKVSCLVDARRREKCAASIRALEQEEPDLQSVEGVGKLLTILWPYLNSKQTAILILIGAFRRFPNILLIRNRVAGLWTMLREAHLGELGVLEMLSDHSAYRRYDRFVHTLSMPSGWQQSKEIDEQLDALVAAGILVRHEGGYMRMPQAIKNWVNEKLFKDAGDGLANLHDLIASAYYDYSFLQSSDIKIFFEYVYHRVESARYTISATTMQRLQVLVPCLRQIRDLALTQGHGAKLARILRQVRTSDVPAIADSLDASIAPPEGEQLEAITAGLEEIEAEVYLKRMDFGAAIAIRQTRLLRVAAALSDSPGKSWIETIATSEPTRSVDSEGQALSTWLPKLLKERPREATALLQNIYEFALAQSGLRQFKIAERLFCELADVCSSIAWDHSSNRHGGREPIARLAIQAEHRKMALHLEQVSIWKFDAGAQLSISEACHAFERAEQWLLQYYTNYVAESELGSNAENSFYVLYKCFLNSLRCRVACLRAIRRCSNLGPATRAEGQEAALREFRLARGFLDLAYALAQRKECTAQTRSARTICRIIEAEMLILYSDVIVQRERGYNKARRILENAEKLLESAADSLGSGNRHLGWWTWLLLLRAQLQHELLALALTDVTMWSEASLRTLFQNGLDAVSAGLVTTAEDDVRRQSFQVLWWQFFACHHVQVRSQRPRSKGRSIQERWKQLNDASGLTWYCDAVESRGILDAFVEQLEWEMPDEPLLRRSWLIQCEKSAIDRLGIQLFLMTGHNA